MVIASITGLTSYTVIEKLPAVNVVSSFIFYFSSVTGEGEEAKTPCNGQSLLTTNRDPSEHK
jgi:hypothetical protein